MGYFLTLAKFLVLIFSGIFLIVGLFDLGVAIALSVWKHGNIHIAVIGIAIFIAVVSFLIVMLGCWGAIRESGCMLLTYAFILVLLFVVTLVCGVVLVVEAQDNNKYLEKSSREDIQQDFRQYKKDSKSRIIVDYLQEYGKCCGVDSVSEWTEIPPSCCPQEPCTAGNSYTQGCAKIFYENFKEGMLRLGYINVGLSCAFVFTTGTVLFMWLVVRNDVLRDRALRRANTE